jgi:spore coat protein CotH
MARARRGALALLGAFLSLAGAGADAVEYRFNCGAGQYVTGDGRVFQADQAYNPPGAPAGYSNGWTDHSGIPIGGTPDQPLFYENRLDFTYRFSGLPAGTYIAELLFADFRMHGPANRVFDVVAAGTERISNLDVFAESGQNRYSLRYRFAINFGGSVLTIDGVPNSDFPILSAVSVWDQPSDAVAPAAPADVEAFGGFERNQLKWADAIEDDVSHFHVYRAPALGGPYSRISGSGLHTPRLFDRNVIDGFTYYYCVTAVDVFGNESARSDTVTASSEERHESALPLYEIEISAANWDHLNDDPLTEDPVPAVFIAGGQSYDVEVRYRGSSTRTYAKKSWKVRFLNGIQFEGRDILNLNAEMPDRSLLREEESYRVLRASDAIASRADHIQLFVNDVDFGVYVSVEDVDREFLDRVGLDPDGNLYRAYDDLSVLPDTAAYMAAYDKITNEGEGYGDLIAFIELINGTPTSDFYRVMLPIFDFEGLYDCYASNAVVGNIDFGNDDYYVYHDVANDKWYWFPWDMNETFGSPVNWDETLDYDTAFFPGTVNNLIAKCSLTKHFKRRHVDRVQQLMDTAYDPGAMSASFDSVHALIQESGRLDWFKWMWEDNTWFDSGPDDLDDYVQLRRAYLAGRIPVYYEEPLVYINEIMASNQTTIPDEFGGFADWVELYNPGVAPVELADFHLTDDYRDQMKWALPDTSIPPGGYLLIWCDGDTLEGPLHANFNLDAASDVIGLFGSAALARQAIDTKEFEGQFPDVSFGRRFDGEYRWQLMATPTPGAPNMPGGNIRPQFSETSHEPQNPAPSDTVWVTTRIWDDGAVAEATLWYDPGTGFESVAMADDGTRHDGAAGDGRYGAPVPPMPSGSEVHYFLSAVDDEAAGNLDPPGAPTETYFYPVDFPVPPLFINELLASNATVNQDEAGQYDDWVELYNGGAEAIALGGKFLTDNLSNHTKWMFPTVSIDPGGFLLVWCDDDPTQGPLHATFKLDAAGEQIGLFETLENGNVPIDTLSFGPQETDRSYGRLPDGEDSWVVFPTPTPGEPNAIIGVDPGAVGLVPGAAYLGAARPNPAAHAVRIPFGLPRRQAVSVDVFDVGGRRVRCLVDAVLPAGHHATDWDGRDDAGNVVPNGVYFYRMRADRGTMSSKILLLR